MYIKKIHILIEQGLQSIGVFAYADMLEEEVDLYINSMMYKMMDEQIEPLKNIKGTNKKFKSQYILDRFQNLQVKELELQVTKGDECYISTLPNDYLHLISDISRVLKECSGKNVATGSIKENSSYLVKGQKSIIYNTVTYNSGSIFKGVANVTGYTYSGTGTLLLLELKAFKRANRLTEEEFLFEVLDNYLEKTDSESPVSSLSTNTLTVYVNGFYIDKQYITYLRKPKPVNSKFTIYTTGTGLIQGKSYESFNGSVTYNGNVYSAFTPFVVVAGVLTASGASVREYQDGDCEFTESMCYDLVKRVILDISIDTEQPQQKVLNLAQGNV